VPVAGVEPARRFRRGILSPLRLPVPPHRRTLKFNTKDRWVSRNIDYSAVFC
jgi:hypothetical protein